MRWLERKLRNKYINKEIKLKEYGRCFKCERVVPMEFLEPIKFFDGHKVEGSYHHQLMCFTCMEKADMIFKPRKK